MNIRSLLNLLNLVTESYLFELFDVERFLERAKGVQSLIDRGATEGEKSAARAAMERMVAKAEEQLAELSPTEQERFKQRFSAIRKGAPQEAPRARRANDDFYKQREEPKARKYSTFKVDDYVEFILSENKGSIGIIIEQMPSKNERDWFKIRWVFGPIKGKISVVSHNAIKLYDKEKADKAQRSQSRADAEDREWRDSKRNSEQDNHGREGRGEVEILYYATFENDKSDKCYGVVRKGNRHYTFWGRRLNGSLSIKGFDSIYEADAVFQSKLAKGYERKPITGIVRNRILSSLSF